MSDADRRLLAGIEVPHRAFGSLPLPATGTEVAHFVALRAAACVGADYSNLASLDEGRQSLRLFHGEFLAPEIADRYTDIPLGAPFPIAVAARTGTASCCPPRCLPGTLPRDRCRHRCRRCPSDRIAAAVSRERQPGRSDRLRLDESVSFDIKLQTTLHAVAELCTATIERAERHDADHQFIVDLSASRFGRPIIDGVDTSARYIPASQTASVGGDWYEGIVLGGQRLALVVGDVTGHGLAAAADMALLRGIMAVLHSGVAVADVFGQVSEVLRQRVGLLLASAALIVVDIDAETLTYATAGHPPPVVQLPSGAIQRLEDANAPMIGLASTERVARTMSFPGGSRLVMFTDGLVERTIAPSTSASIKSSTCFGAAARAHHERGHRRPPRRTPGRRRRRGRHRSRRRPSRRLKKPAAASTLTHGSALRDSDAPRRSRPLAAPQKLLLLPRFVNVAPAVHPLNVVARALGGARACRAVPGARGAGTHQRPAGWKPWSRSRIARDARPGLTPSPSNSRWSQRVYPMTRGDQRQGRCIIEHRNDQARE